MEGTYDKGKKTLTMAGKETTWRSVSRMPDADTVEVSMYVGDGRDPMFTFTYKRRK